MINEFEAQKEKTLKKQNIKKWINFTFAGILFAFVTNYLIIYIEIFSPGLAGVSQGFSYLFNGYIIGDPSETKKITIYWIFYIAFNIPIIWFAYRQFGTKFLNYSLYVLVVNLLASFIFAYIPAFRDLHFFSQENLDAILDNDLARFVTFNLIAIISGVLYGFAMGLTFKNSGSSFGFDPIIKWISKNKEIGLDKLIFSIAILNTLIWTFLFAILDNTIHDFNSFLATFFDPKVFASILYFLTISVVTTIIYPSKTKTLVEINSDKTDEISYYLNKMNYHRNHTILKVEGGYTHKSRKVIQTIIAHDEEDDVLRIIEEIDPNAFIYMIKIKDVHGNFDFKTKTLEEIDWEKKRNNKKNNQNNK